MIIALIIILWAKCRGEEIARYLQGSTSYVYVLEHLRGTGSGAKAVEVRSEIWNLIMTKNHEPNNPLSSSCNNNFPDLLI